MTIWFWPPFVVGVFFVMAALVKLHEALPTLVLGLALIAVAVLAGVGAL